MAEDFEKKAEAVAVRHEMRDISAPAIGCFALALVSCAVVVFMLLGALFHRFGEQYPTGTAANRIVVGARKSQPPEPRLQADPASEMQQFRERENAILDSYSWLDRQSGVVRIPIKRAMELVVERGLPVTPNSAGKTPLQMRQEKATEAKR